MGAKIEIVTDEQRLRPDKSEVQRLWASSRKAHELLGWRPEYGGLSGFERGLARTVEWFTDQVHLSDYKSTIYNI